MILRKYASAEQVNIFLRKRQIDPKISCNAIPQNQK